IVLVNGSASPITVAPGAVVTVTVNNGPALPKDWVAKHISTNANNMHFNDWKYLDGTQTPPTAGRASATLTFTMPTALGTYNFRFFRDNTYQLLATSALVTVGNGNPTPSPTPVPTATPVPVPTATATPVATSTPTPRPTATGAPTSTPTPRPTATAVPTATPVPTAT